MSQTVAIGSDHGAFAAKEKLKAVLEGLGYKVKDFGTNSPDSCDYPDIAIPLAKAVQAGKVDRGVLLCGTGLGMSYAANRLPGVRAALCWSREVAKLAREHNDSNILVLSGRHATIDPLEEIMKAWLETPFSNDERHQRRITKIEGGCK